MYNIDKHRQFSIQPFNAFLLCVYRQDGASMEVERDEEELESCLNWSHVADLIHSLKLLLHTLLTDISHNYQIKVYRDIKLYVIYKLEFVSF